MAEAKAEPKLTSAFDLFKPSWEIVQRNAQTFAILYALPFLWTLVRYFQDTNQTNRWENSSGASFFGWPTAAVAGVIGLGIIVAVIFLVVALFLRAMIYTLELEGAKGKTPAIEHLFNVAKKYWLRLLGLGILVGILTILGLIFFVIPGLIVLRRYFFAPYLMIEKDMGILESMEKSAAMTKPYSGWIYSIIGVMVLLALISVIPIVGWIIAFGLTVAYSVAPALRYQEVKKLPA